MCVLLYDIYSEILSQNEHINKLQRAIKNEQFSDTGKIGYTRRKQTKQKQITQHRILKR